MSSLGDILRTEGLHGSATVVESLQAENARLTSEVARLREVMQRIADSSYPGASWLAQQTLAKP